MKTSHETNPGKKNARRRTVATLMALMALAPLGAGLIGTAAAGDGDQFVPTPPCQNPTATVKVRVCYHTPGVAVALSSPVRKADLVVSVQHWTYEFELLATTLDNDAAKAYASCLDLIVNGVKRNPCAIAGSPYDYHSSVNQTFSYYETGFGIIAYLVEMKLDAYVEYNGIKHGVTDVDTFLLCADPWCNRLA